MLKYIAACVVVLLAIVFFVVGSQNPQFTEFSFIIARISLPVSALVSLAFLIGVLTVLPLVMWLSAKNMWLRRQLTKS